MKDPGFSARRRGATAARTGGLASISPRGAVPTGPEQAAHVCSMLRSLDRALRPMLREELESLLRVHRDAEDSDVAAAIRAELARRQRPSQVD